MYVTICVTRTSTWPHMHTHARTHTHTHTHAHTHTRTHVHTYIHTHIHTHTHTHAHTLHTTHTHTESIPLMLEEGWEGLAYFNTIGRTRSIQVNQINYNHTIHIRSPASIFGNSSLEHQLFCREQTKVEKYIP